MGVVWVVRQDTGVQTQEQEKIRCDATEEKAMQHKITNQDTWWVDWLEIGALHPSDINEVLDLLASAMRDIPLYVAAFGGDPEHRWRKLGTLLAAEFSVRDFSHTLVSRSSDGTIVGVCAVLAPGGCGPDLEVRLRLAPTLGPIGPSAAQRATPWMDLWQKCDAKERHWHLGPVAVDAHLQGMGVGGQLMGVFCAKLDAAQEDACLHTDKLGNVSFFERFGFEMIGEQEVLGVTNYCMLRRRGGMGRGTK